MSPELASLASLGSQFGPEFPVPPFRTGIIDGLQAHPAFIMGVLGIQTGSHVCKAGALGIESFPNLSIPIT